MTQVLKRVVRAAIYCRLSRTGGKSVERQEALGRALCAERGWKVTRVFKEWVPASQLDKPPSRSSRRFRREWEALQDGIEDGQFDVVVLWMEDRSARHYEQAGIFVKLCKDNNVLAILPDFEYDFTDPDHEIRFLEAVLQAQKEIAKMRKRIKAAKLEEAEDGQPHTGGQRPFGFTGSGKQQVSRLRALQEQELIIEAADRVIAGDSLRGIVNDWNSRTPPVLSSTDRPWRTTSLRTMLLGPRMAGYRVHHGRLIESEHWPAIVARDKWEICRGILTDPGRRTTVGGGQPRYLLIGLVFCGVCRERLRCKLQAHGGVGRPQSSSLTYYCPQYHVAREAARLEEHATEELFTAVEERARGWAQSAARLDQADPTRPVLERLAVNQARLDGLAAKEDEALELELDGQKDEAHRLTATVDRLRRKYLAEQERDRLELARLQGERVEQHIPPNLREVWSGLSLDRRRSILAAMLPNLAIVIHRQGRGGPAFDPAAVKVIPLSEVQA